MDKNKRRAEQLGMPHGTANNKLRKSLLFKYVQKAGDDVCVKCGTTIESVDDLSVEHIEPWEGRDSDLFWNLDNIAFSHVQCNRPHQYGNRYKDNPTGHGLWKYRQGCRCDECKSAKREDNSKRYGRSNIGDVNLS